MKLIYKDPVTSLSKSHEVNVVHFKEGQVVSMYVWEDFGKGPMSMFIIPPKEFTLVYKDLSQIYDEQQDQKTV